MIRQRSQGFTLIELLVVIAIIAILAAILFPVFAQAREQARKTSCLSNVKQVELGILMYVQDYDESYPMSPGGIDNPIPASGPAWAWFVWQGWPLLVNPYAKSGQIFHCPSAESPYWFWGDPAATPLGGDPNSPAAAALKQLCPQGSTYMLKLALGAAAAAGHGGPVTLAEFSRPAESVDIYERVSWHLDRTLGTHMILSSVDKVKRVGLNVGCSDGHAKFMRGGQLRAAFNPVDYQSGGTGPFALDMSWYYTNDLRRGNNPLRNSPSSAQDITDGSEIFN